MVGNPPLTYAQSVLRCEFCPKLANGLHPATCLLGHPEAEESWERGLAAMCNSCWKALMDAGGAGKKRKGTAERWWLGHKFPASDQKR